MNIAAAPIEQGDAPNVVIGLIANTLGVELVALDEGRPADNQAARLVSLEELCRLGEPETEKKATTRASDALSEPEQRLFARRVNVVGHCVEFFARQAKGERKREIFERAAKAGFADEQELARRGQLKEPLGHPFSWRTVRGLWRKYVEAGKDMEALKPRFCDRGRKRQRDKDPVAALIHKTLRQQWLTGKLGVDDVRKHVAALIRQAVDGPLLGKNAPSERAIYREIRRHQEFREHMRAIHNKPAPKLVGLHELVERPLDEVQVDEMFFDAKIAKAIGTEKKVSVLFCVDSATGAPLSFIVEIGDADVERARLLMLRASEPKPPIVLANGTTVPWPHGLPRRVKGDRGAIFKSNELVLPLADFNIRVQHAPPYCPWMKGVVENLNHVVKSWLRSQPHAKLTLADLRRRLELAIAERLLLERRRRGEAPIDRFIRLVKFYSPRTADGQEQYAPRMPDREEELLTLARRDRAKLTREGVSHRDIHFRARRPDDFLRNPDNWGREYEIRVHPGHLDYILMLLPDGRWIRLDRADQPDAAGHSPEAYDVRRRQLAERAHNNPERDAQNLAIKQEAWRLGRKANRRPSAEPSTADLRSATQPEIDDDDDKIDHLEKEIPCLPIARF